MDLRSEIEKDGRQFIREKRTLILLFAAPIIVLLVLGGVFGRTSAEIGGTTIGMCDLDKLNVSQLFISGIANNTKINDFSDSNDCDSLATKEVKEGRLAAAVVIPKGFQEGIEKGSSQNLTIILDNSRIQTAPSIEAFMKAAVQETGQKIGTQFILNVWSKLDSAKLKLSTLLVDVNQTRVDATAMKQRLKQTSQSLESVNLSLMNSEITQANSTLSKTKDSLNSAKGNLTKIQSKFDSYEDELNQTETDLQDINITLSNATIYLENAKTTINCSNILFVAYCASIDSLNSTISSAKDSVESRIIKVKLARDDLKAANKTIEEFKDNIDSASNASSAVEDRINNMSMLVYQLEQNRANALTTISEVSLSLDELVLKSYELEQIIEQSSNQIEEITSRDPDAVVSPILLSTNRLFGQRTFFDFLLPSLLPLILMFVSLFLSSTSLVREKHLGTLNRIRLSHINSLEYCAKKVISYTVVLIPEAILLTLIASVFYGVFPILDIGTTLFVLQTFILLLLAFTAIGVVIAIYSESEATAFLASLVIGLPLLFLSGILFPFDFMPTSIALIGQASPLTQAVLSMQSVILYKTPQAVGFGILLIYAIVFTIFAAFSLRRMK